MKQTRLVLALIVTSLMASSALAASVTMLQFGSFETRDEADKKLSDISGKYKDTLGTLPISIREVKLPPDNLTVYRTQAGPVADRATAQSICAKLAATGDECYIVQTAMMAAPATSAVADAAPAPTTYLTAPPVAAGNTNFNSTFSTPQDTPLASVSLAGASETPATNTDASTIMDTTAGSSPGMQSALDKAAADQPAVASDVATNTAAAQADQHRSFWSRMNPFSAKPQPAPVPPAPKAITAPVEAVSSAPLAAPDAVAPVAIITPATPIVTVTPITPVVPVTTTAVAVATPALLAPLPSSPTQTPAQTIAFSSTPVITQAPVMQLPPPPAPLQAQDRATLTSAKAPLAAPESTSAPITITPLPPGVAAGSVQVEEAKRVPVTNMAATPAPRTPFIQAPVSLQPSATDGVKTIWAQMGPFESNDEALAFWASYRQNHPDFPVVRVRVTSSYQAIMHGVNTYWLRIGPIAQRAFVSSLCASLPKAPEGQEPMHCSAISDLGSNSPLMPAPGMLPASRYGARH